MRIARTATKEDPQDPENRALMEKIRQEATTEAEREQFGRLHQSAARRILDQRHEALFSITEVALALPDKARAEPSRNCQRCGEPVTGSKPEQVAGQWVCRCCLP